MKSLYYVRGVMRPLPGMLEYEFTFDVAPGRVEIVEVREHHSRSVVPIQAFLTLVAATRNIRDGAESDPALILLELWNFARWLVRT